MFKIQDKKNKIIFLSIIIIFLILLGLLFYFKFKPGYYAVFLNNGTVYFGKVSFFPQLKIENPVFIQVDEQTKQFYFPRFKDAVWNPKGVIYLNKDAVTFIAPIDPQSNFFRFLKEGQFSQPSNSSFPPSAPVLNSNQQQERVEDKSNQVPSSFSAPSQP
jgi:hypothetical protein